MVKFVTNNEMNTCIDTHNLEDYSMIFSTSSGNRYTFMLSLLFAANEEKVEIYANYEDINTDEGRDMISDILVGSNSRKDEFTKIIYTLLRNDPDSMMEDIDHPIKKFLEYIKDLIKSIMKAAMKNIDVELVPPKDIEEFEYFINLFSRIAAEKVIETYYRKEKLR